MKTIQHIGCALAAFLLWSCSGDDSKPDNNGNNNNEEINFTNSEHEFAGLNNNFFEPETNDYKGIVCLGSGNDPLDPAPGSIADGYLVTLAEKLVKKGYLVAIVGYRDQPPVGNNWENWTSNVAMLSKDLSDVATAIGQEFGVQRSRVVLGGSSYAANALLSHSAWGTGTFADTKGFIAIMGSAALDTAQNIKSPVLAYACNGEPFNTHYGKAIYDNIADAGIRAQSFGLTDSSCSGHNTSNSWQDDIVQRVQNWLP